MTRTYKEIEGRVNFDVSAMDSGFSVRIPQVRDDSGYTKQEEHVFTTYKEAEIFVKKTMKHIIKEAK